MQRFLALDTETLPFEPGNMAPPLACFTWFNGTDSGIVHWKDAEKKLVSIFNRCSAEAPLVFHHAPYDLTVLANQFPTLLPLVFDALDRGAVRDTRIRERLIRIAEGTTNRYKYSLAALALNYFDEDLDKTAWRTSYAELRDLPLDQWPEGAKEYAINDAIFTGKIYLAQWEHPRADALFFDEPNQNRAAFALQMVSNHGIVTDKVAIEKLKNDTLALIESMKTELVGAGLLRPNGSRNMKLAEQLMLESWPDGPKTPTGKPCTDEEACTSSGNPLLIKLSQYRQAQTLLSKDVESLEKGIEKPIHTRFESLLDTGRTSSSGPNIQNPKRTTGYICKKCWTSYDKKEFEKKKGTCCDTSIYKNVEIRECYVPRSGHVFVSCDYEMAELHTLAQVCFSIFGYSALKDKLNNRFDPHLGVAAQLLGITYEDAVARKKDPDVMSARQTAKIANFGLPGGMGVRRFMEHAAGQKVLLTQREAQRLKDVWFSTWPEMKDYFNYIAQLVAGDTGDVIQHVSLRHRGNIRYSEACNSFFQGLAADGAKDALYEVIRACHLNKDSKIYGCRVVNFVHDEIIMEAPKDRADECAQELVEIMTSTFTKWTPDVPSKADYNLMDRWSKV